MATEQRYKRVQTQKTRQEKRGKRLNQLLIRLIVSSVLFLAVFVGGRLVPKRAADVFGAVRQMITTDLDLRASVETIGNSVRAGESIPAALRTWCVDTFLPVSADHLKTAARERLSASDVYHAHMLSPQTDVLPLKGA